METKSEDFSKVEKKDLFAAGHRACGGCGQALAARLVADAAGENTIACVATGCLEVFSSPYPDPAWRIPFLHSLFENAAAVASGVEAAYKALRKGPVNIIAQGGDGSTADIGFQSISGMFERGHNVLYVCYDNEAYMNTGVQRSSFTPLGADWLTKLILSTDQVHVSTSKTKRDCRFVASFFEDMAGSGSGSLERMSFSMHSYPLVMANLTQFQPILR